MSEKARELLGASLEAMSSVVEQYPQDIPVLVVADVLHMKPEALRASIEQGRCPFGFSWKLGNRMAYKIPTVTFCAWVMGQRGLRR